MRDTLVSIAKTKLSWNIAKTASAQPSRPLVDIFADEVSDFSKYRLAKAFIRWTRDHKAEDLTESEVKAWSKLIDLVNKALK